MRLLIAIACLLFGASVASAAEKESTTKLNSDLFFVIENSSAWGETITDKSGKSQTRLASLASTIERTFEQTKPGTFLSVVALDSGDAPTVVVEDQQFVPGSIEASLGKLKPGASKVSPQLLAALTAKAAPGESRPFIIYLAADARQAETWTDEHWKALAPLRGYIWPVYFTEQESFAVRTQCARHLGTLPNFAVKRSRITNRLSEALQSMVTDIYAVFTLPGGEVGTPVTIWADGFPEMAQQVPSGLEIRVSPGVYSAHAGPGEKWTAREGIYPGGSSPVTVVTLKAKE